MLTGINIHFLSIYLTLLAVENILIKKRIKKQQVDLIFGEVIKCDVTILLLYTGSVDGTS